MGTITDTGLAYFAAFYNDDETDDILNKIRIGAGTTAEAVTDTDLATKYSDYGFAEATASTIEYLNTTAHPRTLHLSKTFTNGASTNREVWECGAFTSGGTCVFRHVFQPYELANNNIVPAGQTITIDIYLQIDGGEVTYTRTVDGTTPEYKFEGDLTITGTVGDDSIDPSAYTCEHGKICFNGLVLPNASPPEITEARGAKMFKMSCKTKDRTAVDALLAHQGIVNSGMSVTGYQYATSLQRQGTLRVWNTATQAHTSYTKCYLSGPVNVVQFGDWYTFDITIIQSYYAES